MAAHPMDEKPVRPRFYVCCPGSGWARHFRAIQAEQSGQKLNTGMK